jgi:ketosteroid isomerase-like protein
MPDRTHTRVIEEMFKAMQLGPAGEGSMMELFAADATFTEPFTGTPRTHHGAEAVRQAFRDSWREDSPRDLKLTVDRIDVDGDRIRADWTCTSSAFPTPMRGIDFFRIRDGRIQELEITVTEMPDFGGGEHA